MSALPTKVFLVTSLLLLAVPEVTEFPTYSVEEGNCTDVSVFWDKEDEQCRMCSLCPKGYEPEGDCGHGHGQRYSCKECKTGTYSNVSSTKPCRRCQICENREVSKTCTTENDAVCGDCKYGFFMLEGTSVCIDCATMQDHDYPECPDIIPTNDSTTIPNSTPPPSSTTPENVPVHGKSSQTRDSTTRWKSLAIAACTVLGIAVIGVGLCIVYRVIKARKPRNDTSNSGSPDTNANTKTNQGSTSIVVDNDGSSLELGLKKVRFTPGQRSPESENEQWDSPTEMEPLIPRDPVSGRKKNSRPAFFRSLSAPAGDTDCERIEVQRKKLQKHFPDDKQKKMDRLFEKACLIGRDVKIRDLSFELKENIGLTLNPEPSSPTHKYWFHFGLLWDIEERKLKNFNKRTAAVFDYIEKQGHSVEDLLQKLKDMENPELLSMVCKDVIQQNKKMSS
ncbi:tumor necrosis factor receptor superfamily member EDAR-like [Glandiceps talaboti]